MNSELRKVEEKNCKKKVQYSSPEAAKFFASSDGLYPYKCPICRLFHLTSQKRSASKISKLK